MHSKTLNQQNTPCHWKAESACSEKRLSEIALELAQELKPGDRVFLEGQMGVGKTTFARALLLGLDVVQPPEGSPSFAIAHEYDSPSAEIIHIDFYRLRSEFEIEDAGLHSYFWERPRAIVITEWISSWPDFEAQAFRSGRVFQVELNFGANSESERALKITSIIRS